MSSRPPHTPVHPTASILRHRASALRSFAATIDQLLVTRLDSETLSRSAALADSQHWSLRRHLLDRNLHQLHRAADDLREVSHLMWRYADSLERSRTLAMSGI
jgi:ABC-type transporter Mla subunit MlaD